MGNNSRKARRDKACRLTFFVKMFCDTHDLDAEFNNNGRHWIVCDRDRRVDFWPSTGKVVFNLDYDHPFSVSSAFTFLELINERWRPRFNPLNEEYADIVG